MWRNAERLLKGATKIPQAQVNELGKSLNVNGVSQMFFDVRGYNTLLTTCKPSSHLRRF